MARGIVAYDGADLDRSGPEGWRLREGARPLVDEPLGGEGAVGEFWSAPAVRLGLPGIAAIYERGFYEANTWEGDQLGRLLFELDVLEAHWRVLGLDDDGLAGLEDRARSLRAAVAAAQASGGMVVVS